MLRFSQGEHVDGVLERRPTFHHSFTDCELSKDTARVERVAREGPVAIVADGQEAFVLVSTRSTAA